MGACNGKPRRLDSQKLIEVDENETLNFEITLNNLKGRNFKKVSSQERHPALHKVRRPQGGADPHRLQSLESSGELTSGKTPSSSITLARPGVFRRSASKS
jgi:hypothetical protein